MDYRVCVDLEKNLKTTQMLLSIAKHEILTVLRWITVFVLILRKCYNQQIPYFQVQIAKKYIFCNGLEHLCYY